MSLTTPHSGDNQPSNTPSRNNHIIIPKPIRLSDYNCYQLPSSQQHLNCIKMHMNGVPIQGQQHRQEISSSVLLDGPQNHTKPPQLQKESNSSFSLTEYLLKDCLAHHPKGKCKQSLSSHHDVFKKPLNKPMTRLRKDISRSNIIPTITLPGATHPRISPRQNISTLERVHSNTLKLQMSDWVSNVPTMVSHLMNPSGKGNPHSKSANMETTEIATPNSGPAVMESTENNNNPGFSAKSKDNGENGTSGSVYDFVDETEHGTPYSGSSVMGTTGNDKSRSQFPVMNTTDNESQHFKSAVIATRETGSRFAFMDITENETPNLGSAAIDIREKKIPQSGSAVMEEMETSREIGQSSSIIQSKTVSTNLNDETSSASISQQELEDFLTKDDNCQMPQQSQQQQSLAQQQEEPLNQKNVTEISNANIGAQVKFVYYPMDVYKAAHTPNIESGTKADRERLGRIILNTGFDILYSLLHSPSPDVERKITKPELLQESVECIRKTEAEISELTEDIEAARLEVNALNSDIENYQSTLSASGAPISCEIENKMEEIYFQWIRYRTTENWKFWIFSFVIRSFFDSYNESVSTASLDEMQETMMNWVKKSFAIEELKSKVLESLQHLSSSTDILTNPGNLPQEAYKAIDWTPPDISEERYLNQ